MPGGRPTKYNEAMNELGQEYIYNYKTEHDHAVPSVVGLAYILKCAERTLYNWGNDHPEFLQTLSEIQSAQKLALMNGGLDNVYNSNICKLMLANHGFSERTQDVTGHNWNDEENKWEVEITHTNDKDTSPEPGDNS